MNYDENPFQELYVTDSPNPKAFVKLFSELPIQSAQPLFRPGHVVLKGTQGTGKSMLLNLLRPRIRLAYSQAATRFPLVGASGRFVGAGINLTRSGALDIGQRPISENSAGDEQLFPLYFADFINYYIVRDLLESIILMRAHPEIFSGILAFGDIDNFAKQLAKKSCWFGYLANCQDFASLCKLIDKRIAIYRSYHQYNGELGSDIQSTKTNIGEPIAATSDMLKQAEIIGEDVPVFIRIDQLERLYRSDVLRPSLGHQYRRMINKAVGTRDSRVFYKIGTRTHAWDDDLLMFGTEDRLELMRDFRSIDLDAQMRRLEDKKTWLFPQFANDALFRRLRHSGIAEDIGDSALKEDAIARIFGPTLPPQDIAREYVDGGKANASAILRLDSECPDDWQKLILEIFKNSPLEAVMAVAWSKQSGAGEKKGKRLENPAPATRPWEKPYWRKERVRQALMQLAARNQQRLKWAGKDQILNLSGGNISIFLSICHEVWDAFLRSERRKGREGKYDPLAHHIDRDIQTIGIQTASDFWYNKIVEQPNGHDRQRFVDILGVEFRKRMLDDNSMSYPGGNGFSLSNKNLDQCQPVKNFLYDAADYGDLLERPHTTKEKNREPRTKWYLAPILSPHYQIPESHVKEPLYSEMEDVIAWIKSADIFIKDFDKIPPTLTPLVKTPANQSESQGYLF